MSEHDVEDLVEQSIRALDRSSRPALDVRDGIAALLAYQGMFDTGFTHGRMLDLLIRRGFTVTVPVAQHPAYARNSAWFDAAPADQEITFVELDGDDEDDDELVTGAEDGYLADGVLHADIGTRLWRALVETGSIPASPAPRSLRLAEVVAWVVDASDDPDLVLAWYRLAPSALFADWFTKAVKAGETFGVDPLSGDPLVAEVDLATPRPFTLEELLAVPQALAIRDAGLAVRATRPAEPEDDEEDEDDDEGGVDDEAAAEARAFWAAKVEEMKRHPGYREFERVRAWWAGEAP